jgi:hypothetical protein
MVDETEKASLDDSTEFKRVEITNQEILFHHFNEGLRLFVITLNGIMGPLMNAKVDSYGCIYYNDGPFEGYFPFYLEDHDVGYESWSDSLGDLLCILQNPSSEDVIRHELENFIPDEVDFLEDIAIVQVQVHAYVY